MQTTPKNKEKVARNSLKSAFKWKNKVEERGVLGSRVKREQKSTNLKAQKMMRGRVEPSIMLIMVHVVRQTLTVPHMTSS